MEWLSAPIEKKITSKLSVGRMLWIKCTQIQSLIPDDYLFRFRFPYFHNDAIASVGGRVIATRLFLFIFPVQYFHCGHRLFIIF